LKYATSDKIFQPVEGCQYLVKAEVVLKLDVRLE